MNRLMIVVFVAFVLLTTTGCQSVEPPVRNGVVTVSASPVPTVSPTPLVGFTPSLTPTPTVAAPDLPQGTPAHVTVVNPDGIVVIDVDVFAEGLDPDANLTPGYDGTHDGQAAWFNEGSRASHPPGYPGSAVIAAHATTRGGAFHALPATVVGAVVTVRYSSGDEVRFDVVEITPDLKSAVTDVNTELGRSIWGDTNEILVWLITCDVGTDMVDGHRLGNVVVQAVLHGSV